MLRVMDGPTPVGAIDSPKIALTSVLFPTPTRPASMTLSWAFPPIACDMPSRKNFSRSNSSWPSDLYRRRPVEDPPIGAPYLSCVPAGLSSVEAAAPGVDHSTVVLVHVAASSTPKKITDSHRAARIP